MGKFPHNPAFAALDRFPVQRELLAPDAELCGVAKVSQNLRIKKQSLGGNAAPMQTRASEVTLRLDDRRLQPKLTTSDCCDVARRPAADNYEVELRDFRQ